jgi:hypothetical protein
MMQSSVQTSLSSVQHYIYYNITSHSYKYSSEEGMDSPALAAQEKEVQHLSEKNQSIEYWTGLFTHPASYIKFAFTPMASCQTHSLFTLVNDPGRNGDSQADDILLCWT